MFKIDKLYNSNFGKLANFPNSKFFEFYNYIFAEFLKLEIFWIFQMRNFRNFLNLKFEEFPKLEN